MSSLAISGGTPVRQTPMPPRNAIGEAEKNAIWSVIDHYAELGLDPGYQGLFEERYCAEFAQYLGGGYADAVATGTIALHIALRALDLPEKSSVLVSPITDPGSISAIIEAGLVPKLVDARGAGYNASAMDFSERLSEDVSAFFVIHASGKSTDIDAISALADEHGVKVLEDCSQSHGASLDGRKIGSFGDIAGFSTMYRKLSISGASGGLVFSRNEELYQRALAIADRGKPRWLPGFDDRDPNQFLFPSLNYHTDEISCAIGSASLARLDDVRSRRITYAERVEEQISASSNICSVLPFTSEDAPFIIPVFVNSDGLSCTKTEFAEAILAEGINLNPRYMYLVANWPWLRDYLADDFDPVEARRKIDSSFCLYVNENYGEQEVLDTVEAILKIEQHFAL